MNSSIRNRKVKRPSIAATCQVEDPSATLDPPAVATSGPDLLCGSFSSYCVVLRMLPDRASFLSRSAAIQCKIARYVVDGSLAPRPCFLRLDPFHLLSYDYLSRSLLPPPTPPQPVTTGLGLTDAGSNACCYFASALLARSRFSPLNTSHLPQSAVVCVLLVDFCQHDFPTQHSAPQLQA